MSALNLPLGIQKEDIQKVMEQPADQQSPCLASYIAAAFKNTLIHSVRTFLAKILKQGMTHDPAVQGDLQRLLYDAGAVDVSIALANYLLANTELFLAPDIDAKYKILETDLKALAEKLIAVFRGKIDHALVA